MSPLRYFLLAGALLLPLLYAAAEERGAAAPESRADVEEDALRFVRLVAPFRMPELEALGKVNPQEYRKRITNYADRMRQLDDLQRSDPHRYQLRLDEYVFELKSQQLSEQYRKAKNPEEKERIKSELASLLDRLFDVRGQNKAAAIRDLEMEIDRLKKALAERQRNKSDVVRARLEELLGEKTTPEW